MTTEAYTEYIVLEGIPNTPEGRAFLKQLRKYLRPQYRMRSRGRHSDRKGLAVKLAADQTEYRGGMTPEDRTAVIHRQLRTGMSCKHAETITTVIDINNARAIRYVRKTTRKHKAGYYLYYGTQLEQGPFKTWDAAKIAKQVTEGHTQRRSP